MNVLKTMVFLKNFMKNNIQKLKIFYLRFDDLGRMSIYETLEEALNDKSNADFLQNSRIYKMTEIKTKK